MSTAAASPPRNPHSPRRPLSLADRTERIATKITGIHDERTINVTESNRIRHQNQLHRSAIEGHNVPLYTSFRTDSAAYNLTVNFDKQSGRRHDDPRFKMYKAMIKHPEGFELSEKEKQRRSMLQEIDILATIRNVEVSFDEATPRISPRETKAKPNTNTNGNTNNTKSNTSNGNPLSSSKRLTASSTDANQKQSNSNNDATEAVAEAFAVDTFHTGAGEDHDEDDGEEKKDNGGASPTISFALNSSEKGGSGRKTTKNASLFTTAGGAVITEEGDVVPEIVTPRSLQVSQRIETQLRARETLISEITSRGAGAAINPPSGTLASAAATVLGVAGGLVSVSSMANIDNKDNKSGQGAEGATNSLVPSPPSTSAPQQQQQQTGRRQSIAVPVIMGGSETITEAAKALEKKNAHKHKKGGGRHHHHRNGPHSPTDKNKMLKFKMQQKASMLVQQRGRGKRKGHGEDGVDSNPSEEYEDIPLIEGDGIGEESDGSSSAYSSSSDDDGGRDDASSVASRDGNTKGNALTKRKGDALDNGVLKGLLLNDTPVTIVRSFHLSGNPSSSNPTGAGGVGGVMTADAFKKKNASSATKILAKKLEKKKGKADPSASAGGGGGGSRRKSSAFTDGDGEDPDRLESTARDDEGNGLLTRGGLGSGINIEIPTVAIAMPNPVRGVTGASMLTMRDQIVRSVVVATAAAEATAATPSAAAGGGQHSAPSIRFSIVDGGKSGASGTAAAAAAAAGGAPPIGQLNAHLLTNSSFATTTSTASPATNTNNTNNALSTLSNNWCLTSSKKQTESTPEHTHAAVVTALSTPRAVRDLFPMPVMGGAGIGGNGSAPNSANGLHGMASARTSFYQQGGGLSFAGMKRPMPSFAGFGGGGGGHGGGGGREALRKGSMALGLTSTYGGFGGTTTSMRDFGSTEGGGGGGMTSSYGAFDQTSGTSFSGFGDALNGVGSAPTESALTYVIPPVVFKGLTSSGAGNPQPLRRKRTMAVSYGLTASVPAPASPVPPLSFAAHVPHPPPSTPSNTVTPTAMLSTTPTMANVGHTSSNGNTPHTVNIPTPLHSASGARLVANANSNSGALSSPSAWSSQQQQRGGGGGRLSASTASNNNANSANLIQLQLPQRVGPPGRGRLADGSLTSRI